MRKGTTVMTLLFTAVVAGAVYAEAAGTVPTVGGYSKHDFTVGIVTQVEGGAYALRNGASGALPLAVGAGIYGSDQLWVEPNALARFTDTAGGRVTVAGPAVIGFTSFGKILIRRGAVKLKSADGQILRFENPYLAGSVSGEGAVWAGSDIVQVVGLAGDVRAWHPNLSSASVALAPGFYSESAPTQKHLQPKRPVRVDERRFQAFLTRFERSGEDAVTLEAGSRSLAAEPAHQPDYSAVRGSRTKAEVVEPMSEETIERLQARMAGRDFEDDDEIPLAAPGPRLDAYGRTLKPQAGRKVASQGPSFEVVNRADKKNAEAFEASEALLKKIYKKRR